MNQIISDNPIILMLIKMSLLIAGIIMIFMVVRLVRTNIISKIKDNENRYKTKKLFTALSYLLSVLLITIVYKEKLGGLTVALGVAGAGIAFAMQEVIVSFAGWIAIMSGGYFKTGDRIQLGGIKGDVMDIGVLRTTIMEIGQWVDGDLYNGRIVYIVNSFVFKEPVFNYSKDFRFLWDEIKIPVQFGSNYEKTKEILLNAGKVITDNFSKESKSRWLHLENKYRLEDTPTEPMVSMIVNSNWVEFTLRYIVSYKKRRVTKSELFLLVLKDIDATGGDVKFPLGLINLGDIPEIKVNLNNS